MINHFYTLLDLLGLNYTLRRALVLKCKNFGFGEKKQLEFLQDFSSWINDGCSPRQACASIMEGAKNQRSLKQEYDAAKNISDALSAGDNISVGMSEKFNPTVVTLFEAGQKAGKDSLTRVINEYLKQEAVISEAKKQFWKPIKQPMIYFFGAFLFLIGMGSVVIGQFTDLIPIERMGSTVIFVKNLSDFTITNFPLILSFLGITWVLFKYFVMNNTSHLRLRFDNYFPLNIYKNFECMKTLKTLGILVETRYNLRQASLELKKNSSRYINYHLDFVIAKTQFGETDLANALDSGLLSKRLMFRLRNAANSPDQSSKKAAISIAADRSGDEAVRDLMNTRNYVTLFFWLITIITMLLVLKSFMSVITAMFNMSM